MEKFQICSLSSSINGPSISIATIRAGGVGLLDLDSESGGDALRTLVECPSAGMIGVRIDISRTDRLPDRLGEREHWLILAGWNNSALAACGSSLAHASRHIWLEISDAAQLKEPPPAGFEFHGWVARGSETGGVTGVSSAFFLAQCLARQPRPFLLQGGIGLRSAAACRVAGATGVILDDALLLMRDSPIPEDWKTLLRKIAADETRVTEDMNGPRRYASHPSLPAGRAAEPKVRWGAPEEYAWPVGQGIGLAQTYAESYRTTGRFIQEVARAVNRAMPPLLVSGSPLAQSHRTQYPIVQGPMTRVSDRAEFAAAVAEGGALPLLALALLRKKEVEALLRDTGALLEGRSWGVGILGFVPPELREEQLDAVRTHRPPFALMSGGRPDQAARLEALGIATYLHAPSAGLLQIFLRQGARRFVFEGSECGGHTGPLSAFPLWEQAIHILLTETTPREAEDIHVLFAGGIHDARSAAMVSAMAAPLADRGIRVGVLLGTAYLFTNEAVQCGAILQEFQDRALDCDRTVRLETGMGHVIRIAATPFASEFRDRRERLRAQGLPPEKVSLELEGLTLGRSRVASKGIQRGPDGELRGLDADEQRRLGMYMMGDAATLRDSATTIRSLHEEVVAGSMKILQSLEAKGVAETPVRRARVPVAIVGASCLVPGAATPEGFWRNLLDRVSPVTEIPARRFDWRLYYDADPNARDRISSKWGGFIDELPFDPIRFGIPPASLKSISLSQLIALEATRLALNDAGLANGNFDRENTAVVFGTDGTADLYHLYVARAMLPLVSPSVDSATLERLPEWTEESFPGQLMNVISGRVANRFDLGGPNYTVDAACASSLAALDAAVQELESGRSNLALAGGVDLDQTPYSYLSFSKTRALSPRGKADTFDKGADGIVTSEGAVVLVLKRLADAERDGDRIYAVIRSVAGSSDGKGLGLTAPKPAGQIRALNRAYSGADIDPATLGLYEAHGTGTPAGDRAEAETIVTCLSQAGAAPGACAIGSAKSLLGHTKAAAGLVGILKAALALYHRTLPPHAGVSNPLEILTGDTCPVRMLDQPQPWLRRDHPRRAGVSAFGFGGTNFHAVLEEYRGNIDTIDGADTWPCELFVFRAETGEALARDLETLRNAAAGNATFRDLAFTCAANAKRAHGAVRLSFVAAARDQLCILIDAALNMIRGVMGSHPEIHFEREAKPAGDIGFLFPGQGSQYPGMARELALYFPELRDGFEQGDEQVVRSVFPPAAFTKSDAEKQAEALSATQIAQPAIGLVSCGMLALARRLGLRAARVAGHSYGEYSALYAAGVLNRPELIRLSKIRGTEMSRAAALAPGAMAAVHASREQVESALHEFPDVALANLNSPRQFVVSGPRSSIEAIGERLAANRIAVSRLPVAAAFHSPLMRAAAGPLTRAIQEAAFVGPSIPVHCNRDGSPYPGGIDEIRSLLSAHLESPVDFAGQVESMYEAGARVFIELGPKRVLTSLTSAILEGRTHLAVAFDSQSGSLKGFLNSLAELFAHGVAFNITALFAHRQVHRLQLNEVPALPQPEWFIDGGRFRRNTDVVGLQGSRPLLTAATAREAVVMPPAEPAGSTLAAWQAYQATMRAFMGTQETLFLQVLDRVNGTQAPSRSAAPIAAPAVAPPASAPPEPVRKLAAAITPETLRAELVQLVSDKTGYPPDMLGLDLDIEGELGVNSIKRIEILTTLESRLPDEFRSRLATCMDELTRVRTLRAVIDSVLAAWGERAPVQTIEPYPRFVMKASSAAARQPLPRVRRVAIVPDNRGVAGELTAILHKKGIRIAPETEAEAVLHLASLTTPPTNDIQTWRAATSAATKSLLPLLRRTGPDLRLVVAATAFGGRWNRSLTRRSPETNAAGGGVHGVLRTLAAERSHIIAKTVDFNPAMAPVQIAELLTAELLSGYESEVGYPGGERTVFTAGRQPLDTARTPRSWRPEQGAVVLVTGGARGITARIAKEIAKPGVRLILVGSGELQPDQGADTSPAAIAALRAEMIAENRQIAPGQVEARVLPIVRAREKNANLKDLRGLGADVEYLSTDVRDPEQFGALIDDVYRRFGRLDGVIHGAGIIEDKRIEDQSDSTFDRVFDTKADSAWILLTHLRSESLKWLVLFGSVSGRFGNAGQSNYAAGNEVLNRLAWQAARKWPEARVVCINWGPWQGSGMVDASVNRVLTERGILSIPPDSGCGWFCDEMSWGLAGDVEVVAGEGPWGAGEGAADAEISHDPVKRSFAGAGV